MSATYRKKQDPVISNGKSEVTIREKDNLFSKSAIWVESRNFYGHVDRKKDERYIIIGFDSEFKTPGNPVTIDEVKEGFGKYTVLSYQFHCSVYDPTVAEKQEWSGICYPNEGERLSLADVIKFAIWKGVTTGAVKVVPTRIYLVGHFTRADVPAFSDFQDLTRMIASVRNTFLSIDNHISLQLRCDDGLVDLMVLIRDTMLLTPATSKSLDTLGELVGVQKIQLDPDPAKELDIKKNMDVFLREQPEAFEEYAINDAVICVRYLETLIEQCVDTLGERKVPATLTAIGLDLLLNIWKGQLGYDPLYVIGKEMVPDKYYSKSKGHFVVTKAKVNLAEVERHISVATECYHGGRNEQFWFGPAFEDDWTDYDLAGAYPTAMAMIGMPDWRNSYVSLKLSDFTASTLGVATVEFEFPAKVRFPTMPVRTDNGLVFPLKGVSDCAAPEIALAKALGAKLTIKHGVIIPTNPDKPVFADFIKHCVAKRREYPKKSMRELFWKELTNSSYGKTAQGLRQKRVYDLRDREMKQLPESKITNPFFAAFITSFVRAALGETINALPESVCVFSCTTDGFLTNATPSQIAEASTGELAELYNQSRERLVGKREMLEIKHQVRKPLGWRTRGQATLIEGPGGKDDDTNIVLAKGGIYTPNYYDGARVRNQFIVDLFINRTPESIIEVVTKTGIREMVDYDADLVEKQLTKRLNMEFDWKRLPSAVSFDASVDHVAFSTEPWETVEQFARMREYWEMFTKGSPQCIKTIEDYRQLAVHVLSKSALDRDGSRYLKRTDPDLKRLRQMLCIAFHKSEAGLIDRKAAKTADQFAEILTSAGVACKRTDVENGKKKAFVPHRCPSTPAVITALNKLKQTFPELEIETIVASGAGMDLMKALDQPIPFLPQFNTGLPKLRQN